MFRPRIATEVARPETEAARPAARAEPFVQRRSGPAPERVRVSDEQTELSAWTRARQQTAETRLGVGGARKRELELSAGSANARGVRIGRVTVGPRVGHVVIDKSRGVQVGDGNRQLNKFRLDVEQPRVSADDVLRWHPMRQRAFTKLVENPDSWFANWAFRQHLSGSVHATGNVRFISASTPRTGHVAARLDERGQIVVDRSRGVQIGSGSTQLNKFNYRVEQPRLSLEPMLRDNPGLTRSLALTARYPGSAAVERSFTGELAQAYKRPSASMPAASVLPRGTPDLGVRNGMGVQFGRGNDRKDSIDISVGRVRLTHWTPPRSTAPPRDIDPAQPQTAREPTIPGTAREATEPASLYRPGRIDPTGSRISPSMRGPGGRGGFSAI
jgi:RIP homotypic interaction motif